MCYVNNYLLISLQGTRQVCNLDTASALSDNYIQDLVCVSTVCTMLSKTALKLMKVIYLNTDLSSCASAISTFSFPLSLTT